MPDSSLPTREMIEAASVKAHRTALIRRWSNIILTIILYLVIGFVFIFPMLYVLGNSLRTSQAIWENAFPVSWKSFIPYEGLRIENYIQALGLDPVSRTLGFNLSQALLVSALSSIAVICCSLIFNTGAAYFFARLKFPKKNALLIYVLATMMIPQQVVMVPLFLVVNSIGLIDNFWAMVIPWYASPFIVFSLTQFMKDIPYELDEAAIMDGANYFQVLIHVIIPNALTGMLTVSLLEFQFIWNEFYWPLVAISSPKLFPVQVAIATQFTERDPQWGRVFAAMVMASLPIIILFMALQKYFFKSVALSGIKG